MNRGTRNYPLHGGALSNAQKATLCIMSREAFDARADAHADDDFAEWRHEQQRVACGKDSLRDAVQTDYLAIRSHFKNLLGNSGGAFRDAVRAQTDDRNIALVKLRNECAIADIALEYANRICRAQNKCALTEASGKQLWRLIFTIRNRASARRKSGRVSERESARIEASNCPF